MWRAMQWRGLSGRNGYAAIARPTVAAIGLAVMAIYLAQHLSLAPNTADGALILEYVRMVADGKRPFFDFIDLYGPLNWIWPAIGYHLADGRVIGIRIGLLLVKICAILAAGWVTRRLSDRFYSVLSMAVLTVLLGQPWQYLQTAYSFFTALPLVLFTWGFMIGAAGTHRRLCLILAALTTALTLWVKLNTGAMLLAGGLFVCFFWLPQADGVILASPVGRACKREKSTPCLRALAWAGIGLYGLIFFNYMRPWFDKLYFLYLALPLLLALVWTATAVRQMTQSGFLSGLKTWAVYLGATAALAIGMALPYFGMDGLGRYVAEMSAILTRLQYHSPFPPLGLAGIYHGFNEYYWPQLPWLVTAIFGVWLYLQAGNSGRQVFHGRWTQRRVQIGALVIMAVFNNFVIYCRADETHLFQAVAPAVPVLFVLVYEMEQWACWRRQHIWPLWRAALTLSIILALTTIGALPRAGQFQLEKSAWRHASLQGLRLTDAGYHIYHESDLYTNQAAAYIDDIAGDGDVVLVFTSNQMLNFNSNTRPVGNRYQYIFYLLRNRLIDRADFDYLVPAAVIADLLANPPNIAVSTVDTPVMLTELPEFNHLLATHYRQSQQFGHILIYERRQ